MSDILSKISSYNIFNNLLPGIIFSYAAEKLGVLDFEGVDIVVALFIYYFIGLAISRAGSLFLDPILRSSNFAERGDYADFLRASAKDSKLEILLEVGNTYRSLASAFICLWLLVAFDKISRHWELSTPIAGLVLSIAFVLIFLFAYRKQSEFIRKRVDFHNER